MTGGHALAARVSVATPALADRSSLWPVIFAFTTACFVTAATGIILIGATPRPALQHGKIA